MSTEVDWYKRSLHAFLLAFSFAIGGLILVEIGQAAGLRDPASPWRYLQTVGYACFVATVLVSFYSLYAGVWAWISERRLCWWALIPVLLIGRLLFQLAQLAI